MYVERERDNLLGPECQLSVVGTHPSLLGWLVPQTGSPHHGSLSTSTTTSYTITPSSSSSRKSSSSLGVHFGSSLSRPFHDVSGDGVPVQISHTRHSLHLQISSSHLHWPLERLYLPLYPTVLCSITVFSCILMIAYLSLFLS